MLEYKTIKQIIDTPDAHDFIADADTALNEFMREGWTVEDITYRTWNDGPADFYADRYVTLKRDSNETSAPIVPVLPADVIEAYRNARNAGNTDNASLWRDAVSHLFFVVREHVLQSNEDAS